MPIYGGVVQWSVLRPLLFLLFVNVVVDSFGGSCTCKLYADDIKLCTIVEQYDCKIIQDQLDVLQLWSNKWKLSISYTKCNTIVLDNRTLNSKFEA